MLVNTTCADTFFKNDTKSSPIGVFDSGVGGLSIFNCIKAQLPNEQLIYVADSLYAPYGDKSDQEITDRVNVIANTLLKLNCKALVVACNTATVTAIDQLRLRLTIPIIGVEPAIKPAVMHSRNRNIGILTTQATANNKRFLTLVDKYKLDTNVHIQPCPGLVELIENNQLHSLAFDNLLTKYLNVLKEKQIDTIVLGCTHYPFFAHKIKEIIGNNITIMETALPVTEQLKRQLLKHEILNNTVESLPHETQYQFFSSEANEELSCVMSTLINIPINLLALITTKPST